MMKLNLFKDVPDYRRISKLQESNLKKNSISLTISHWLLFFTAKFGWQEKERSYLYIHVLLVDNEGFEYATTLRLK